MLFEKIKFSLLLVPCYLDVNLGIRCNTTLNLPKPQGNCMWYPLGRTLGVSQYHFG